MLSLMLKDHIVDEAVYQQRIAACKVCVSEGFEYRFADGAEVEGRVVTVEQVQGRALLSRMEGGVVHVVELPIREPLVVSSLQQPQLLIVADVTVVPNQRAHDLV